MKHIYFENNITKYLDEKLKESKNSTDLLRPVALINGLTGSGKTPSILSWLEHNNLNYIYFDAKSRNLANIEVEYEDWNSLLNGQEVAIVQSLIPPIKKKNLEVAFQNSEIDKMNEKNTVVVVDDYDLANLDVRKHFLSLLLNQTAVDPRNEEKNYITKLNGILMFIYVTHPVHSFSEPYTEVEEQIFGKQIDIKK